MGRQRRIIVPGVPHHVVQRASHQAFIIDDDRDKAVLMRVLLGWQLRTSVRIAAFVIMGNHFHLVAVSPTENALGEFMGGACAEYSRYYNTKCARKGPNWESRYYAAPMDDLHTVSAIRYVERNPVAANLVADAWNWPWSSAAFHVGAGARPQLLDLDLRPTATTSEVWRTQLMVGLDAEVGVALKKATRSGRAFGAQAWADAMDRAMGKSPARRGEACIAPSALSALPQQALIG